MQYRGFQFVTRYTDSGMPYDSWEQVAVPKIDDEFLDCSIYLYGSKTKAKHGEQLGGSGCLVKMASEAHDGFFHYYAVTNRHVITDGFPVIRLNNQSGAFDVLEMTKTNWYHEPDQDIAICPLGLQHKTCGFTAIGTELFVEEKLTLIKPHMSLALGVGAEVFMVGRFINHEGKQKNLPSARFGNIAMMPLEPVYHEQQPNGQEAFLVDVKTRNAYSGSPVFVYRQPIPMMDLQSNLSENDDKKFTDGTGSKALADLNKLSKDISGPWLLGIEFGQIHFPVKIEGVSKREEEYINQSTGMAAVVPAWRLEELLNKEVPVMQRREQDKKKTNEKKNGGTVLESAAQEPSLTRASFEAALGKASRKTTDKEKRKR